MWNPFRKHRIRPVLIDEVDPAASLNPSVEIEIERQQLRSLTARVQISMIHDRLAEEALCKIKGGGTCPD